MKKLVAAVFFIFLCGGSSFSQFIPIKIEQKISQSSLIIEGRVTAQKSYMTIDGEIYTDNRIKISRVIKGWATADEVSVITMGGRLDSVEITWTHMISFTNNEYGVFFLIPTGLPYSEIDSIHEEKYEVYAGSQGFYRILMGRDNNLIAVSAIDRYDNIDNFYSVLGISHSLGEDPFSIKRSSIDSCIEFIIMPIEHSDLNANNMSVTADILVRVKYRNYNLYKINFELSYNTDIFGTNIVSSENLTYTNGDFPVSHYDLVFKDIASNKLGITLQAKTTNTEYFTNVGSDYQKVARIQLSIIGISNELPVSWDGFSGDYENLYVEESTGYIKEFDCIKVVFGAACEIDVTDFEPAVAAAGVGEVSVNGVKGVVTIRGSGFMNAPVGQPTPEGRYVKFSTIGGGWIAPLEGDYISWTDNEIKVKVPSIGYDDNSKNIITDLNTQNACTGKIRVCKDTKILFATIPCGCNDDTNTKLYVPFSARNTYMTGTTGLKNSVRTLLRSFNGSGGYTIYFTQDFKNYTGAVDAYKRALTTWRCATQVNFDVDEISDPPAPGNGICVVEFWNLPVGTTSVTRGATLFSPLSCGGSSSFSYLKDFRMRFNKNLTWHTGANKPPLDWEMQGDLESTALHEIGHAHLLNHTCNTLNVMIHPGVSNFRRELTHDDESGGDHVSLLSNHINETQIAHQILWN